MGHTECRRSIVSVTRDAITYSYVALSWVRGSAGVARVFLPGNHDSRQTFRKVFGSGHFGPGGDAITTYAYDGDECAAVRIRLRVTTRLAHRGSQRGCASRDSRCPPPPASEPLPLELPGGQQQRVAIARAMVKERPLSSSPTSRRGISIKIHATRSPRCSHAIRIDFGFTTIIVAHDDVVAQTAKRRLRVHNGVVTELT